MIRRTFAVVAGYLTLAIIPMFLWVMWPQVPREMPLNGFLTLSLLIGVVAASTAGAVTAAIARGREVRAAAALALVMVVLEVIAAPFSRPVNPRWYDITALLTSVAGVMVGGIAWTWLGARLRAHRVVRLYEGLFSSPSAYPEEEDGSLTDRSSPRS